MLAANAGPKKVAKNRHLVFFCVSVCFTPKIQISFLGKCENGLQNPGPFFFQSRAFGIETASSIGAGRRFGINPWIETHLDSPACLGIILSILLFKSMGSH